MNYSVLANASEDRPKVIEHELPQSSSSEGGISCYLLQNQIPIKQFQSSNNRFDDWKFESPNRPDQGKCPLDSNDASRPLLTASANSEFKFSSIP